MFSLSPVLVLLAHAAEPQGVRVNGPLAQPVGGRIEGFRTTREGAHVVYVADQEKDERVELFLALADASKPPTRISPVLAPGFGVVEQTLQLSADDRWAVFQAEDELGNGQLWSARIDAPPAPVLLGAEAASFAIDPSGTWVVYQTWDLDLRLVPIDGSAPARTLNTPDRDGGRFDFDPTGGRIVYTSTPRVSPRSRELFSVPLDGSAPPVRISGTMVAQGNVQVSFRITADGERVLYRADQEVDQRFELFSTPLDGSAPPVKLNGTLVPGGNVGGGGAVPDFQLSPDGRRVVYRAEEHFAGLQALYSAPVDGSRRSIPLTPVRATSRSAGPYAISPDGRWVVFTADLREVGVVELFRASTDARVPLARLSAPMVEGGDVGTWPNVGRPTFAISGDSRWVVYRADQEVDGRDELYRVSLRGGMRGTDLRGSGPAAPVKLNPTPGDDEDVGDFEITSDDRYCVFQLGGGLFRFPLAGGGPAFRLDVPRHARSHVHSFALTERGRRAIFIGDRLEDEVDELFSVALDLDDEPVRVSPDLPIGPVVGDVLYFDFSPDSRWIVYSAWVDRVNRLQLFSTPVHGRGPPRRLSGVLDEVEGGVVRFRLRGERAFFTAYPTQELLWAPVDASLPARSLTGPMAPGGWVKEFEATSDGTWAVYRADQETVGFERLHSVLVDGGGPPVDLLAPDPQIRSASDFELTPDERAVVFLAYDGVTVEVYTGPIEGGVPPLRLSAPRASGSVEHFELTPDGTRVVYRVRSGLRSDLYSVPRDASLPAEIVTNHSGSSVRVNEFSISADSTRVLYLLSSAGNPLFTAPLDASAPPGAVNRLGAPLDRFRSLMLTADARAVFQARDPAHSLFQWQLYSTPIDGSEEPRLLSLQDQATTFPFPAADGSRAIYWSDGLWSVPPDGSRAPVQLLSDLAGLSEHPMPSNGSNLVVVGPLASSREEIFQISALAPIAPQRLNAPFPPFTRLVAPDFGQALALSPDGRHLLYCADQEEDEVYELFLSRLAPSLLPR